MDLASFIPGVGPTSTFTPGGTTPPPFNGTHTGVTDGTSPATASNNVAEIYNRVLLNIAATVSAAGIPIDANNWAQLPAAVTAIANQAVSGFAGTIGTPPQFDNDTSIATTEFVQRSLGNVAAVVNIAANTSLAAADAGKTFFITGAGLTITLNPFGLVNGGTYTFISDPVSTTTLLLSTGGFRPVELFPSGTSFTMRPRSQYTFTWDGSYFRPINAGSAADLVNLTFGDQGYVRFANGIMFQWGWDITPIGEITKNILFGWAFPTACRSVSLTGRSDGTTITNNNVPQLVSFNASSFTYLNQGIAETANPITPNQGVYYVAVGN